MVTVISGTTNKLSRLSKQASAYMAQSVAPTTCGKYTACFSAYVDFCQKANLQVFPLAQENLILFGSELAEATSHSNINLHLASIKYFAALNGFDVQLSQFTRLYRMLRGIKRMQGNKFKKPKRSPITPPILRIIRFKLWNSSLPYEDKVMLWAAMLTAFFGFLRVSEYTSTHSSSYDPTCTLCCWDVSIPEDNGTAIDLQIKASKTDPFRAGVTVRLAENKSLLCPVEALIKFSEVHPSQHGPLFTFKNGSYLTRNSLMTALKRFKPDNIPNISSHSFRIGAATTAAAAGYPRWLIQALGRWSSDCYKIYLRVTDNTKKLVSESMAWATITDMETYDPDNY